MNTTVISTPVLAFDSGNNYVDCGSSASLNLTQAITLEAWVSPIQSTRVRFKQKQVRQTYQLRLKAF